MYTDFDTAVICECGHVINDHCRMYPQRNKLFCPDCGAKAIHTCPNCNHEIKGNFMVRDWVPDYTRPAFCEYCGEAFPWTKMNIEKTAKIIQNEENIPDDLRDELIDSLPDIISETPGTPLAFIYFKKVLGHCTKVGADALIKFAVNWGCEVIKESVAKL